MTGVAETAFPVAGALALLLILLPRSEKANMLGSYMWNFIPLPRTWSKLPGKGPNHHNELRCNGQPYSSLEVGDRIY